MQLFRAVAVAASAIVICIGSSGAAWGQSGSSADYTATIEAICRQYASTQIGMPAGPMFEQCMTERHCRRFTGSAYQCDVPGPMSWHGGGY